ncbi:MAG: hypothetical protein AAF708_13180, partial [Deinococcota bacterium]
MSETQFCSLIAQEKGLDPIGYSTSAKRFFALENSLPWPKGMWLKPEYVPAAVPKIFEAVGKLSPAEQAALSVRPLMVAPDADYSTEGYKRFFVLESPEGLFADYTRTEYLVPEAQLSDLIWTALMDAGNLPHFAKYQVDAPYRDFLVC